VRWSSRANRTGPGPGSRLWQERFDGYTDETSALGFAPVFQRMWQFCPACAGRASAAADPDAEQFVPPRRDEV
jgi:cyclopropane-fatty-acyl-phospholipid synthase